jgi:hypothetical protein
MAQRTIVELTDDIDGKPADETVPFGLDGTSYELDLSSRNADKLRSVLSPFVQHGRRLSAGRGRRAVTRSSTDVDSRAVRAWAASNGIELSARGRIPAHVLDRYRAAGN